MKTATLPKFEREDTHVKFIVRSADTELALLSLLRRSRRRRRHGAFESLEHRNMLAVLVDVGYHLVEPNTGGQRVTLSVISTDASDAAVAGFDLRAQIVTAKQGPYFESVRFAGDLWNSFPHVESGSPFPTDRTLASGRVAFTQGFEARADGTLVTLTIDTTGIPAGSYEFRLVGTRLGSSSFLRTDGSSVSEIITNGTLQVRSIWQNPDDPDDINGDGRITPLDVLLLLNELSKKGSRELPLPSPGEEPPPYYDVNGDGFISPLDPLGVINCLNGVSCVTTPKPILAQVTPDFAPDVPGSTSVGKPVPDDSNPEDLPPDEVDPDEPTDCPIYELDENGEPVPVIDPDFCKASDELEPDPIPVVADTFAEALPASDAVIFESLGRFAKGLPAASRSFATILPAKSVDAAIVHLVDELSDEETSDELVDLGLGDLFALS